MSKRTIIFIFLFQCIAVSIGQPISELQYEISAQYEGEKSGEKIDKARKLQKSDPFNQHAAQYILNYYHDNNIDSISFYFDNLIENYPNDVRPYLLRADFLFFEHNSRDRSQYKKLITDLFEKALKIDSLNKEVNYRLAKIYYEDFIYPLEVIDLYIEPDLQEILDELFGNKESKEPFIKESTFEFPADSALKYFYSLWELNPKSKELIYYPIRQLECYLEKNNSIVKKEIEKFFKKCYFSIYDFANLNKGWECIFTVNYLELIKTAANYTETTEEQHIDLNEQCLSVQKLNKNDTIYRFTYLPTFDKPIIIRVMKSGSRIDIHWKIGKAPVIMPPQGMFKSGKKKGTIQQWQILQYLVSSSHYEQLPTNKIVPMYDGATWTLERKTSTDYKVHHTNLPNDDFSEACLFLIKICNLKLEN